MADQLQRLAPVKRGTSVDLDGAITDTDNAAVDISDPGWVITAGARSKDGRLRAPFTITKNPVQSGATKGHFSATTAPSVTVKWHQAEYLVDFKIVQPDGTVRKSPDFILPVTESSTD